jgi:hypothetical protein
MKKAYLAGDGLKRGNQILRGIERDALNDLGTLELFNPWDQKDINDKSKNPTAEMIFAKDTQAMLDAEVIVVDVDNNSVGTTAEMGQMWGVNFMLELLDDIVRRSEDETNPDAKNRIIAAGVRNLMRAIPYKHVLWQTTDVRDTDIPESGHRRSHSLNQYLHGMMLSLAGEDARSFDSILEELKG